MKAEDIKTIAIVGAGDLVGHHAHVLLDHGVFEATANQTLDGEEGVLGIGDRLALGGLAYQHLAVAGEGDDGGRSAIALRVFDDLDLITFHDGDAGVRGAQVDADDFSHDYDSPEYVAGAPRAPVAASMGSGPREFQDRKFVLAKTSYRVASTSLMPRSRR